MVLGRPRSSELGADVVCPVEVADELWERIIGTGDVSPAGTQALDVLRMEAGIARFGKDYGPDTVLQELDAADIVSFTKGCYLGQEIVARIHYLGQPSKLLRRLEVDGSQLPNPGDRVRAEDGKDAGVVTSAAESALRGPLVFAMVKKRAYAPGMRVVVESGGVTLAATVRERALEAR